MSVHVQKQSQPQPEASLSASQHKQRTIVPRTMSASPNANADGQEVLSGVSATTRFAHDFTLIPLHSHVRASIQPERAITTSGDRRAQDFEGMAKGGVVGSPVGADPMDPVGDDSDSQDIEDEEASIGQQAAIADGAPVLGRSTVSGPTTSDCGGFDWRIDWKLDKRARKGGVIVQKVDSTFEISNCAGHKNIYPDTYWEMWRVKRWRARPKRIKGASYDDVFRFAPRPNVNKGKATMSGEAQFYPAKHPRGFAKDSKSQAGEVPMSRTDPGLTGGTGLVRRSITAEWNCCSDSKDRTTYVTTEE